MSQSLVFFSSFVVGLFTEVETCYRYSNSTDHQSGICLQYVEVQYREFISTVVHMVFVKMLLVIPRVSCCSSDLPGMEMCQHHDVQKHHDSYIV